MPPISNQSLVVPDARTTPVERGTVWLASDKAQINDLKQQENMK